MRPQVVILGAGFAGHTAALHLSHLVKGLADVTVVAPRNRFTWFPSLIWVGIGAMREEEVVFSLAPVYERLGIAYVDGRATTVNLDAQTVTVQTPTAENRAIRYDFLLNATGPYLNFEATPGLGPSAGTTASVCSVEHAVDARKKYLEIVKDLKSGKHRRLVVGVGHATATCEGAAFEYLMNVDADLRARGVRDNAELVWLSNEPEPGDFGVDGIEARKRGILVTGAGMVRMLLDEASVRQIIGAGVTAVASGEISYEQIGEDPATLAYDFAMLIPQFRGIPLQYVGGDGTDMTAKMTMPNGFMRVDADYTPKTYDRYAGSDWPALYRSPHYANVYAAGIAFAPPHPMSKGKKTASGMSVIAMAPRTGMASGIMGRTVAYNIADQVAGREPSHRAPMSAMPAACIASMGKSIWTGSAASIIMVPVARDYATYPGYGRDLRLCDLDVGRSGAWTKRLLHSAFMWKLQAKPGWRMIPE
ncbi:MAG TPA: FAD-dependent oxidoreductase [Candidatus Dormibacteraeota bacterium]|nr:FAD-dependent oxidoreductase [Candidatus Dormibacteraeota bacterium]